MAKKVHFQKPAVPVHIFLSDNNLGQGNCIKEGRIRAEKFPFPEQELQPPAYSVGKAFRLHFELGQKLTGHNIKTQYKTDISFS